MEARALFDAASFGPDALKVITQAFDAAWGSIVANYVSATPRVITDARISLANAVLSAATEESRDVATVRDAALAVMAGK